MKDLKLANLITEAVVKNGYYKVHNQFRITPGGGWFIRMKEDSIVSYFNNDLKTWNPVDKKWVRRRPPIQGTDTMDFDSYSGSNDMRITFNKNTTAISKKEALALQKKGVAEETLTVKAAMRKLKTMKPSNKVKITYLT